MDILFVILKIMAILIIAPIVGGLLTGADRVITAKMQSRKGPPLLQPFYDVIKLLQKESTTVNNATRFYITASFLFYAFTVVLMLMGMDILLCIFAFTIACIFFVIAGYSSFSPFSLIGAERELIQIMCYEPMILITAFGFYHISGTFTISEFFSLEQPMIIKLPLIFIGLSYILTIKLRKSPFDLSMSHHGHQELVKGITTELTGICMAMVEVCHWLETVFALGFVYLFFVFASPYSHILAVAVCLVMFFIEIIIDNAFARSKWRAALSVSWQVTIVCGAVNLFGLGLL